MRVNNLIPVMIFAVNVLPDDEELLLVKEVVSDSVRALTGVYNGNKEQSYIVQSDDIIDLSQFYKLLHFTKQESILFLDNQRQAQLRFATDDFQQGEHTVYLGQFQQVSAEDAISRESFTLDHTNNKYYACV